MDATPSTLRNRCCWMLMLACLVLSSCETLKAPGSAADWFARNNKGHEREVQSYRTQWQTRRDGEAIRWLLATQIHNGLTPEEVNERLGDSGELEINTKEFARQGDGFRVDDQFYRYGPDKQGRSHYLGFRDGKLINFDSERYAAK